MSNIYVTEPPYSGKVVLETNKGDIELELFAKECPLTCKNFIALALEGYYDNLIWHRLIPNFIIQSGDPTGTGLGGESFYGSSFSDEFHQRLRFNRRGLIGMANASTPNSNDSQFFLTLASTPELQARHTMFGRISSNTIYNLVNLAESAGEIAEDDRPTFPPKLKTIRVIENPFEGEIELRISREERAEIKKNKREAAKRKSERDEIGNESRNRKRKNTALLSFGQEEDAKEEDVMKGPKSSHDLLKNDKRLKAESALQPDTTKVTDGLSSKGKLQNNERDETNGKEERSEEKKVELGKIRDKHSSNSKQPSSTEKIAELEASLRGLSRQSIGSDILAAKRAGRGKNLLQEYRDKYKQASSLKSASKIKDEETTLLLSNFQKRLRTEATFLKKKDRPEKEEPNLAEEDEEVPDDMREYGDSDEDIDWRNHKFDFGGKAIANDGHDNDEYVTLDPRDTASSKASLLGFGGSEGAKKAREEKAKEGRRGRDWVDPRGHPNGRRKDDRDDRKADISHRRSDDIDDLRPRKHLERW